MAVSSVSIGRFQRRVESLLSGLCLAVGERQRPSLRALLLGLLRFPSPFVADIARGLGKEYGPSLDAREHRLLRFLGSPKFRPSRLGAALRRKVAAELPLHGRVFLYGDPSDLAKPYASRMEGLDWVKDGSDPQGRIVRGYWLNQVYVELEPYRFVPAVFELFSLRSGEDLSQTEVLLRGMDEAFQVTGRRGVFVADCGMDAGEIFEDLLRKDRDFIIRLKAGSSSRCLLLDGGPRSTVSAILRHLPLREILYEEAVLRRVGRIGWARVRLPDRPDRELTLVVAHMQGHDEPLALLTTLPVLHGRVARQIVAVYLRRWNADEDSVRFVKQTFRLEKYLVAKLRRMKAWVLLVGVATALLALLDRPRSQARRMARDFPAFKRRARTFLYRLARAVSEFLLALAPARYRTFVRGP